MLNNSTKNDTLYLAYLKYPEEKEKWLTIDYNYMTKQSPSENEDVIRQHKLTWHSQGRYIAHHKPQFN